MKNFKKLMALVVAMAMVISTLSAMTVAAATSSRTLTISGLEEKDTVKLYKVLSWADDTAEAGQHDTVSGWYAENPFTSVLNEAALKAAINNKNQLVMTDTLAGDLARALNGYAGDPIATKTVAEGGDSVVFTLTSSDTAPNLLTDTDGLYVAIITAHDQDVVYNPVFVHLDSGMANGEGDSFNIIESSSSYMNEDGGAAKKSRVTLTKESENANDYTDTCATPNTHADNGDTTKPGDVLKFTVNTTIPGYGDTFEKPYFNLSDTMKDMNLVDNNGDEDYTYSITVKDAEGNDIPKVAAYPTITALDSADGEAGYYVEATKTGYTIKFTPAYLKTLSVPTGIVVEYQAKVLEGANTNVIKEKNTVVVDFSHDPTTETDATPGGEKQYKKDITNHYTFSIDANNLVGPDHDRIGTSGSEIIKVAVDKNGEPITSEYTWSNVTEREGQQGPLAGAEFELLDKNKQPLSPRKIATSDASGRINFTGLDAGVYWLQETKAPAGYVKQSDPVQITIEATMDSRVITEYYDQAGNWYDQPGTGRTEYKYSTEELESYTVTYGTQASKYTFNHVHESGSEEIKWSIATSSEAPQSIVNTKGVELPSTGGMGTTIFYIIGAVLVIGAGILLVTRRRMSAN